MNKILIILVLFLLLVGGIVFYQLSKISQSVKVDGKVTIGTQTFDIETVKSDKDKQVGLTKYKSLKENQGMLFVFDNATVPSFWMKNMKFPIDIVFVKDDKIITLIEEATPPIDNTDIKTYKPDSPINYVLEIKAGLVKKYNFKKGDDVKIESK